jgi:hypothetical protein
MGRRCKQWYRHGARNTDDVQSGILNDEPDQSNERVIRYVDFFNGRFRLCDYSNAIPLTDDEDDSSHAAGSGGLA